VNTIPHTSGNGAPAAAPEPAAAAHAELLTEIRRLVEVLAQQQAAGPEPLTLGAAGSARLVGVSEANWWRLHAAAKVPRPTKLGGKTLWKTTEIRDWVAAGMPPRREWEALQARR
jgi:predicted DNA-binding transcriptional regulator AlpA